MKPIKVETTTTVKLFFSKKDIKELNKILKRKSKLPDFKDGDVIKTITINFGNGFEADIKVCNATNPYVDPVLFEIVKGVGQEVCVGDVSDTIDGEYHFSIDNNTKHFIVHIIPE